MASMGHERTIVIVDDDSSIGRLFARVLTLEGYECQTATDPETAMRLLEQTNAAVVITDLRMPGKDGVWLLGEIRRVWPDTAVIVLTGFAEVDIAVQCLRDGASDFLTKPVRNNLLVTAVERSLERRRLVLENRLYQETLEARVREATREVREAYREIADTYERTLVALSSALDAREEATADHSRRVTTLSLWLAREMGLERSVREQVARAALLHDIGKIGVPDHILHKTGPLDSREWELMRSHPDIGYRILSPIPFLEPAAEIVLAHHEHFDGTGYPKRIAGDAIPIGARVFAVADAVDAITNDRPYRAASPVPAALEEVERCTGSHFDPEVVDALRTIGPTQIEQLMGAAELAAGQAAWADPMSDPPVDPVPS